MATFLLYIEAFFNVLSAFHLPLFFLLAIGQVAGGVGIANEKRWGYYLAVGTSAAALYPLLLIVTGGLGHLFSLDVILNFLFPVVLVALLVHPMSRQYQRIWFR